MQLENQIKHGNIDSQTEPASRCGFPGYDQQTNEYDDPAEHGCEINVVYQHVHAVFLSEAAGASIQFWICEKTISLSSNETRKTRGEKCESPKISGTIGMGEMKPLSLVLFEGGTT